MSRRTRPDLDDKLFRIASAPRAVHRLPGVLHVERLAEIPGAALFRPEPERFRVLELGSGWGEFLCQWLERFPDHDYVAFEIKADRIRKTLKRVQNLPRPAHLRIVPINFAWFLEELLPPKSFDWIVINFPDPWPKRRHWKHRLVQPGFPARIARLLRPGGTLHLATDYGPYARRMLGLFRRAPEFAPIFAWPHYVRARPAELPATRFEELTGATGRRAYFQQWRLQEPNLASISSGQAPGNEAE